MPEAAEISPEPSSEKTVKVIDKVAMVQSETQWKKLRRMMLKSPDTLTNANIQTIRTLTGDLVEEFILLQEQGFTDDTPFELSIGRSAASLYALDLIEEHYRTADEPDVPIECSNPAQVITLMHGIEKSIEKIKKDVRIPKIYIETKSGEVADTMRILAEKKRYSFSECVSDASDADADMFVTFVIPSEEESSSPDIMDDEKEMTGSTINPAKQRLKAQEAKKNQSPEPERDEYDVFAREKDPSDDVEETVTSDKPEEESPLPVITPEDFYESIDSEKIVPDDEGGSPDILDFDGDSENASGIH